MKINDYVNNEFITINLKVKSDANEADQIFNVICLVMDSFAL